MILSAPHVMVDRDFWDWVYCVAGAVGGAAGAWAIWYAARTRREVAVERRRIFELDVLREMVAALDAGLGMWASAGHLEGWLKPFALRLSFLHAGELPQWRRIIHNPAWYAEFEERIGATRRLQEIDERQNELRKLRVTGTPEGSAEMIALEQEGRELSQRTRAAVDVVLRQEMKEAVSRRADANLPRSARPHLHRDEARADV